MNAEELKEAIIRVLESNLEYYSTGLESFEKLERGDKESVITGIEGLVDEYANQSKWISVEDSLPEEGQIVLSIGTGVFPLMSIYECGEFYRYVEPVENDKVARVYFDLITHWQPLPTFNEK